jgi:hypothetical protein
MIVAVLVVLSLLSPAPDPAKPPAEKVWTNPDVEALESKASLSIIGQAETQQAGEPDSNSNKQQNTVPATAPYVKEQDPSWYAQGIDGRRERVEQLDNQIQEIQQIRTTGEGISGAIPLDKTAAGLTPEATIQALQVQKSRVEEEINELQDLAQSNGIERDAWR